jgi:hypothetical protein
MAMGVRDESIQPKKRFAMVLSLVIIVILVVSIFAAMQAGKFSYMPMAGKDRPFYVGVTYCGDSVIGAEQLIDSVRTINV